MPFGPDCEFDSFSDCTKKYKNKDDPDAYCAEIKNKTEEHCKKTKAAQPAQHIVDASARDVRLELPSKSYLDLYRSAYPEAPLRMLVHRIDRTLAHHVLVEAAPGHMIRFVDRPSAGRVHSVLIEPELSLELRWIGGQWEARTSPNEGMA